MGKRTFRNYIKNYVLLSLWMFVSIYSIKLLTLFTEYLVGMYPK